MDKVKALEKKVDRLEEAMMQLAYQAMKTEMALEKLLQAQRQTEEERRRAEEERREFWRSLKELKEAQQRTEESLKALSEAHKETEKSMKEFQRKVEEFKKGIEEFKRETQESFAMLNRKWAELSERLGTLAEDILAPGIPYLLERLGYKVKNMWTNEEVRRSDGVNCEFDVVAVAEKDGKEVLFLCEVKSKLREKHFEQLKRQCELYKRYGMRRDLFIIPVLAALNIPEHLVNYASKRGVLLIKMGGDYLEALNPEVLN